MNKFAKPITISPYDVVVQEAVRELGTSLNDVDVIKLEVNCPGDRLAWVSNQDLLKGKPGKEKIIHLCLKKIKDRFKKQFGKEYSALNPSDSSKMKEIVKEFLKNVVLPHEHVHIQQELENQGEFGISPELEAEKAENWGEMEQFGIKKAMVRHLDRVSNQLEATGMLQDAYLVDIVANTLEKDASLERYYAGVIDSILKKNYPANEIVKLIRKGIEELWDVPSNFNKSKAVSTAWKKALKMIGSYPSDILKIAKALKLKSGLLAESTMPLDEWSDLSGMSIQEFTAFIDSSASDL